MLGGGTFTAQDRVIPGAYINFVSAVQTGVDISGRGIVAIPLALSWGKEHTVQKITAEEFRRDCLEIFGYPMESRDMLPFRELFKNAVAVYYYRLNSEAIKSSNNLGEARYGGGYVGTPSAWLSRKMWMTRQNMMLKHTWIRQFVTARPWQPPTSRRTMSLLSSRRMRSWRKLQGWR